MEVAGPIFHPIELSYPCYFDGKERAEFCSLKFSDWKGKNMYIQYIVYTVYTVYWIIHYKILIFE